MLSNTRILVIEGNPDLADLYGLLLGSAELHFVASIEEAHALLDHHRPAVVLSGEHATFYGWRKVRDLAKRLSAPVLYCTNVIAGGWEHRVDQAHTDGDYAIFNTCDGLRNVPTALHNLISAN